MLFVLLTAVSIILTVCGSPTVSGDEPAGSKAMPLRFVNPIAEGADPWIIREPQTGQYLWCFSDGNRGIAVSRSNSLTRIGLKQIVWQAPDSGPCSREVWAPELHFLDDHWYIYFAASDGRNENHQAFVLQSAGTDPFGEYTLHGPLQTGERADADAKPIWAIDMTVLQLAGRRYAVWSGWDAPGTDRQFLYIAEMSSPTALKTDRVRLCDNADFDWERTEPGAQHRGLNEGPQVFQHAGSTWLVYSCGASWLPTYKLGLLRLTGTDPLDPRAWQKQPEPCFQETADTWGVGHSCWVASPDGQQLWHIYHAKRDRNPGWRRAVFAQPMQVSADGRPIFGQPVKAGQSLELPSGDPVAVHHERGLPQKFSLYGHHQFFESVPGGYRLGRRPNSPVNEYRSGEKLVSEAFAPNDFEVSVRIEFNDGDQSRDAGLLFRCTRPSVGYDAQQALFAGLIPRTGLVILGRTDGSTWRELSRRTATIDTSKPQLLTVRMHGSELQVLHNDRPALSFRENTLHSGSVGLRVVDADATFTDLQIRALP